MLGPLDPVSYPMTSQKEQLVKKVVLGKGLWYQLFYLSAGDVVPA